MGIESEVEKKYINLSKVYSKIMWEKWDVNFA